MVADLDALDDTTDESDDEDDFDDVDYVTAAVLRDRLCLELICTTTARTCAA